MVEDLVGMLAGMVPIIRIILDPRLVRLEEEQDFGQKPCQPT